MRISVRVSWVWLALAGIAGNDGMRRWKRDAGTTPSATVKVSPKHSAVVVANQTQLFNATVTGSVSDLSVTWSVDGTSRRQFDSGNDQQQWPLYAAGHRRNSHRQRDQRLP